MPTALIADDEALLREDLRDKLAIAWPELTIVAEAANGAEAATLIDSHQPDVAFLDIRMPAMTGLEVAQGVEGPTRLVFVTAYDEFAVQAFERAAVDYLLKPTSVERLSQTVARLKASLAEPARDPRLMSLLALLHENAPAGDAAPPSRLRWIRASRGDTTYQIPIDDVLSFQSDDKVTLVLTARGEHVIRTSLAELLPQLDGERFWQVHRGTVVQVDRVKHIRRDGDGRMTLQVDGLERPVSVSRAYQARFKQM
ncbi:MAG: response regulator transcription factor [Betaproteobacteria bacterium]|nr:response regulator transcription factor [Betaproteobacteria bacterium]